ncbi:MAG: hypothetical protein KatS3mg031_0621 [Chitinophagales bacterium]|nr:MAG: hypothetical protein KatS3mg031_0621 [Chitinophagales bacterium]
MLQRKPIFFTALFTAIVSLLLFFVALWNGWFGPSSGVGAVFCEASRDGLVKQPANTWSNLAFVVAGLLHRLAACRQSVCS